MTENPKEQTQHSSERLRNSFKPEYEIKRISEFIRKYVKNAGARGVVVGISGGIDSAVVASLCKKALNSNRVMGLLLFEDDARGSKDYNDAKEVVSKLRIKSMEFRLTPVVKTFQQILNSANIAPSKITLANIKARSRMILLYAVANQKQLLVAGTGDKSEAQIGYFTKYGDGGADFLPIAHLYKTEVRALGSQLGVPDNIVNKPSSPNLWKDHKITDEIPADYPILDKVLTLLYDSRKSPNEVSKLSGVSLKVVNETIRRHIISNHKREMPAAIPD